MKIGDFVTNDYHEIRRYGKVIGSVNKKDGWRYFDVQWVDDEAYKNTISSRKEITDKDHTLRFYRADKIQKFNINETIQTLLKLQNLAE